MRIRSLVLLSLAVLSACAADPPPADPATHLSCKGSATAVTVPDHDDRTVETRSPQELAAAYAVGQSGPFSGTQKVAFGGDDRADIVFLDQAGKATAVLSYRHDAKLGWRLATALSCP